MKKMILSIFLCTVLVAASAISYCCYMDVLAAGLLVAALIPSCLFEEGRKQYKAQKK